MLRPVPVRSRPRRLLAVTGLLLACLLPLPAGAQEGGDVPVTISSSSLFLDAGPGVAVFTGNVEVIRGSSRMTAGKLTVFGSGDGAGDGGQAISRMEAEGQVVYSEPALRISGGRAIYDLAARKLVFSGENVEVHGCSGKIRGGRIEYDLERRQSRIVPSPGDRVSGEFLPGGTGGTTPPPAGCE